MSRNFLLPLYNTVSIWMSLLSILLCRQIFTNYHCNIFVHAGSIDNVRFTTQKFFITLTFLLAISGQRIHMWFDYQLGYVYVIISNTYEYKFHISDFISFDYK
jgi:hypothetical protein